MRKSSKRNIHLYFGKEVNILYHLISLFFIVGYGLDLVFNFRILPKGLVIADIIALAIITVAYVLSLKGTIEKTTSAIVIIYSSTIILILAYFYLLITEQFSWHIILQDFITIPPLIFSMGFIVNKRNMLALGTIFVVAYPLVMYFSPSKQLHNSALFVAVMIFGAMIAMLIFIRSLENSIAENEKIREEISRKNKELLELNNQRTKLFSVIAHDLRNPIGSALNISSFLLEDEHPPDEQKELAGLIYKQNKKAYELLESLLNWAKNEQGFTGLQQENISLKEIANNAIIIFEENIKRKELKVKNIISQNIKITADKVLLETIFRNLISNAIKFSFQGGEIIISAKEEGNFVTFSIKDSGTGIHPETLANLFTARSVAPSRGTKEEMGAGIGLKLTKDLVEKNGGKIWAESKVGEGSTFYVKIPVG